MPRHGKRRAETDLSISRSEDSATGSVTKRRKTDAMISEHSQSQATTSSSPNVRDDSGSSPRPGLVARKSRSSSRRTKLNLLQAKAVASKRSSLVINDIIDIENELFRSEPYVSRPVSHSKPSPNLTPSSPSTPSSLLTPDSLPSELLREANMQKGSAKVKKDAKKIASKCEPIKQNKEMEIERLKKELEYKDQILQSQQQVLQSLHQYTQCQICLNQLEKPYALVPCGHIACLHCLQQWFRFPGHNDGGNEDGEVPRLDRRKKTCPVCRTVAIQRPIAAFLVKDIALQLEKTLNPGSTQGQEQENTGRTTDDADPWKDIFPSAREGAIRGLDGALIDHADGGVRRCYVCLQEIYGGMCVQCNLEYDPSDESENEVIADHPDHWDVQVLPGPDRNEHSGDDEGDGSYESSFIDDGELVMGYDAEESRVIRYASHRELERRRREEELERIEVSDDDDIVPRTRGRRQAVVISDDDDDDGGFYLEDTTSQRRRSRSLSERAYGGERHLSPLSAFLEAPLGMYEVYPGSDPEEDSVGERHRSLEEYLEQDSDHYAGSEDGGDDDSDS